MNKQLLEKIKDNPVIAAIKSDADLGMICTIKEIEIVFVLYGDILTIKRIVKSLQENNKTVFVHIDLINGLSSQEVSVDYIKNVVKADGIISTKASIISRGIDVGLYTILRFFVLDSIAYSNIKKNLSLVTPDFIEIMPGVMPKIIKKISKTTEIPVLTGGLVADKDDVISALSSGAVAISSTNHNVWNYMLE